MRDHNKAAGDLAFIVVQSDEDAQKLTDAAFSIEELQAELLKKDEEIAVAYKLLDARNEVIALIPECAAHGSQCVPHAKEWIQNMKSCEVRLRKVLLEIERFGHAEGHGRGYTCANMAAIALGIEWRGDKGASHERP